MFSDLPNVDVVPVSGDEDLPKLESFFKPDEVLKLGLHSKEGCDFKQWDKQFYEQAGVPFEARWKRFFVPSSICALPGYDSCFVHEDKERGYLIDRKLLPHMRLSEAKKNTPVIFDWIMPIINAVEIHCIESSLALLADSLPDLFSKNPRLVLHRYARPDTYLPTYKRNWEIIN